MTSVTVFIIGVILILTGLWSLVRRENRDAKSGLLLIGFGLPCILGSQFVQKIGVEHSFNISSTPMVSVSNKVEILNQQVIEVRKEVADVKVLMRRIYDSTRTDVIYSWTTNKVRVLQCPSGLYVALKLDRVFLPHSTQVFASTAGYPTSSLEPLGCQSTNNVILYFYPTVRQLTEPFVWAVTYIVDEDHTNVVRNIEFKNGSLLLDDVSWITIPN